jgi:hypothetical protein
MIRIYLDTNLITKLHLKVNEDLGRTLERHKGHISFVYSSAHIDDLKRSTDEPKTIEDLTRIKEITSSSCLVKYFGHDHLTTELRDPIEFYHSSTRDQFDIRETFNLIDDQCRQYGLPNPFDLLKNVKHGIDINAFDQIRQQNGLNFPENAFDKSRSDDSVMAVLEDMINLFGRMIDDKSDYRYKDLRKVILDHFPTQGINDAKDVFGYLDSQMLNSVFKDSYESTLSEDQKGTGENRNFCAYDKFIDSYSKLDLYGYRPDEKFNNMLTDAQHAYYGSFCDVLVSNDKKLRGKCEAIYREFKISTLIADPNQLEQSISQLVFIPKNLVEFVEFINAILESPFTECSCQIDSKVEIYGKQIAQRLWGFFNQFESLEYTDQPFRGFMFRRVESEQANKYFANELNHLISESFQLFGNDIDEFGEFFLGGSIEVDTNDVWRGRKWFISEINWNIQLGRDGIGFYLFIFFPKRT